METPGRVLIDRDVMVNVHVADAYKASDELSLLVALQVGYPLTPHSLDDCV
jgi:hypothetical protein